MVLVWDLGLCCFLGFGLVLGVVQDLALAGLVLGSFMGMCKVKPRKTVKNVIYDVCHG